MPARPWYILILIAAWSLCSQSASAQDTVPSPAQRELPVYTLDTILDLALQRHPTIEGARGVIDQREGDRVTADAYLNPTVTYQTANAALRDPSNGTRLTESGLIVTQPIEWLGKRSARHDAAEAGLRSATVGLDDVKLNLIADVRTAFYDLLLAERTVELFQQNVDTVEEVARIVRARVRSGEGAQFESVKAEVEVLKAKQELMRAINAVRIRLVALDTLTAGALGARYKVLGQFRTYPDQLIPERVAARSLALHPAIQRQEKLVEQAEYTVSKEKHARVPNFTFFGGYARDVGREAVVGGVSVPTPIWYRQQGHIAAALGTQRSQEAELLRLRNDLRRAITQHAREAETAQELIMVYERGLMKQSDEALRIAQLSFRQGASSLLDVLDAQRVQRQIVVDYNLARYELSLALTRLERAVGGTL